MCFGKARGRFGYVLSREAEVLTTDVRIQMRPQLGGDGAKFRGAAVI